MKSKHLNIYLLTLLLMSPTLFDLIRKCVPGQPNYVVVAGTSFTLSVTLFFSMRFSNIKMPIITKTLLLLIFGVFFFYSLLGLYVSPFLPAIVFFTKLCPILLTIATFKLIQSLDDYKFLVYSTSAIPIILCPSAIISMAYGNNVLPFFLRPVDIIYEYGKNAREGGFDVCSSAFCSGEIMATSILGISILTLSLLINKAEKQKPYLLISAVSSSILIFASTRRGALIEFLVLFCLYVIYNKAFIKQLIIIIFCAFVFQSINHKITDDQKESIRKRSDFAVSSAERTPHRFNDVFVGFSLYWCKHTPWGTYLGFGGREASIVRAPIPNYPVETGAAQLISETGILGLLIWTSSLGYIGFTILRRSFGNPNQKNYYHTSSWRDMLVYSIFL